MANLKIRVYKAGNPEPATTVTIPGGVLQVASKLIPKRAMEELREKGIDVDEIVNLSSNPEVSGTLVEVEDHEKNERIVISLE
jgi:hypothetical protein